MEIVAAHADWSVAPAKRWVAVARRAGPGWVAHAPAPVWDPTTLVARLGGPGVAVALGLDLPLGVPRAWAAGRAEADFPALLRGLVERPDFFDVSTDLETVGPARPFYPGRALKGTTRAAHAAALGLGGPDELSRWCDRATTLRPAGAPLFWTLGANQTGKAAIAAWRDWLAPALAAGAPLDLWPFAGPLAGLLAPGRFAIAEVYPAEALRHCGIPLRGKRDQARRRAVADALAAACDARRVAPDAMLRAAIADGFGADAAGEDRFDCVVGLLGLIGVLDGSREDFIPADPWVRNWEGWVLGQTALPRGVDHG